MKWLGTIGTTVSASFLTLFVSWVTEFLHRFDYPPERAGLAVSLLFRWEEPQRLEDRFRVVLCWLEGDSWGDDTRTVEQAFAGIAGVELVRSHRAIKASGAADQWRPDMQEGAREVLDDWNADLVRTAAQ